MIKGAHRGPRLRVSWVLMHRVDAGIAFPTCINVNNIVCHNSPLRSDPPQALKDGDLVKMYV
jgi:methionine aminopeptidase